MAVMKDYFDILSQMARWCWGILGKEIGVALPSFAVLCIRNFYPLSGLEEEFAFEGFRYAYEWLDELFHLNNKLKHYIMIFLVVL